MGFSVQYSGVLKQLPEKVGQRLNVIPMITQPSNPNGGGLDIVLHHPVQKGIRLPDGRIYFENGAQSGKYFASLDEIANLAFYAKYPGSPAP